MRSLNLMRSVSIVVCVHNGAAFLAQTIETLLEQSWSDWELILVDDGSSDASADIVRGYDDARFVLVQQPNQGAAVALTKGIARACGEFVALLDQDDLWHPDYLALHLERLRAAPAVGLTFSWFTYVDPSGRSIGLRSRRCHGTFDFRQLLSDFVIGATSNVVLRRHLIAEAGGIDPGFPLMYDLDLCLRVALLPNAVVEALPRDLMRYRRRPGQLSRDFRMIECEWGRVLVKMRRLAPADVAAAEGAARCSVNRYFARLAYEQRQFSQSLRYSWMGLRAAPLAFFADGRNWLTLAACMSGAYIPHEIHATLERVAGLRRPEEPADC